MAGEVASVVVELDRDPAKVDHVWIKLRTGESGALDVSLSTTSRQSRALGLDPRLRVGVVQSHWTELPSAGVRRIDSFDYATVEAQHVVEYVPCEREAIETMLVEKANRAFFVEAWGELYVRAHAGIHQVHSRRASAAVPRDVIGRDGGIQFYFRDPNMREMLLFKYRGQQ
ncbi:MAG: hypothetical protein ACJ8HQ_08760 [Chthoniobacterales bacterium]